MPLPAQAFLLTCRVMVLKLTSDLVTQLLETLPRSRCPRRKGSVACHFAHFAPSRLTGSGLLVYPPLLPDRALACAGSSTQ